MRESGPPVRKTRTNHEIRLSPVRVVDQDNKQIGIIDTREALRMAEEAGLDLVEIQPNVRPPLCKIMDYGKYRYELSKKAKSQRSHAAEMKEVRLGRSAKIGEHDVEIRVKQARRFLMDGHKVQFIQKFRGREMAFQEIGRKRLDEIAQALADIAKVEIPARTMGRQMSMILAPDKAKVDAVKRRLEAERAAKLAAGETVEDEPEVEIVDEIDDDDEYDDDAAMDEAADARG
jgi:translation initiation factor IF-3